MTFPSAPDNLRTDISDGLAQLSQHPQLHNEQSSAINAIESALLNGMALVDKGGQVFNVKAYLQTGESIATNAVPAIQRAYAALVAAGGGVLLFPPATYVCNDLANAAALAITRDNTKVRGLTWIVGYGATVQLSANTPRFIDLAKVADYDTFYNLRVEGLTVDANNIGGQHHIIIGTEAAGVVQQRINLDRISVRNCRGINGLVDATTTNYRVWVYLSSVQQNAFEATQNTITNIVIKGNDCTGGNEGYTVKGQSTGSNGVNVYLDRVYVRNNKWDQGVVPTTHYNGAGVHLVSQGWGDTIQATDNWLKGSGDVGVEIDACTNGLVRGNTVLDVAGTPFYYVNFCPSGLSGQQVAWTARDNKVSWSQAFFTAGGHYTGDSMTAAGTTLMGTLTIDGLDIHITGLKASFGPDQSGVAFRPCVGNLSHLNVRNVNINLDSFAFDKTADAGIYILAGFDTTATNLRLFLRNMVVRLAGSVTGTGNPFLWWVNLGPGHGGKTQLDVDGISVYESLGSVSIGQTHALVVADGTSDVAQGVVAGLVIESGGIADDTNPVPVRAGGGTGASFGSGLTFRDCDFSPITVHTTTDDFNNVNGLANFFRYSNRLRTGSTIQAITAITVGASPFTYTNADGFPETVTVEGGTVSSITLTRGATTTGSLGTSGLFYLSAGDKLNVTYTVAPTMRKAATL